MEEVKEEVKQEGKTPFSPTKDAYDWLESVVSAIVICILIFIFAFRVVSVKGSSMLPTLVDGEKVVISRFVRNPNPGDIIVLTKASFSEDSIVKRVIATEGQTVEIDFVNGIVRVDGVELVEPYIADLTHRELDMDGPVTVAEGCVFCMGDNRNGSTDSRAASIGQIDTRCILGKVLFRVWPISALGGVYGHG